MHYNPKWFEYGFLDETWLSNQVEQVKVMGDESTEHYRYAAFKSLLESNPSLDDLTIAQYIELAELDEDQTMAQAALALLARSRNLTDEQLDRVKSHVAFRTPTLQDIITQHQLLRTLDADQLTDEVFERCVTMGNRDVQRKLLGRQDLSAKQLLRLMTNGSNRAVRNLARQRLHKIHRLIKGGEFHQES